MFRQSQESGAASTPEVAAVEEKAQVLNPTPLVLDHIGFTCQQYAMSAVLQWLYQSRSIENPPAPPCKRENPRFPGPSLRALSKRLANSAVGEIHNILDLAKIAETQSQVSAYFCECKTQVEYTSTLMAAIQQGLAPIVFFEVEDRSRLENHGHPIKPHGDTEHAAVLVGYFYKERELFFTISQWETFFDVKAKDLFDSTSQLPRIKNNPENYIKFKSKGEGAWLTETYARTRPSANPPNNRYIHYKLKSRTETNPTTHGGLACKILILDSTVKPRFRQDTMPVKFNRLRDLEVTKEEPPKNEWEKTMRMSFWGDFNLSLDPARKLQVFPLAYAEEKIGYKR